MGAKRIMVGFCVVASSVMSVWAGDAVDASIATPVGDAAGNSLPSLAALTDNEPWIHPSMPEAIRNKLDTAFDIAIERVSTTPQCAGLFEALGADPLETLKTGLYFPANPARETSACRRSFAQTYVGEAPTWICRRITSYSDEQAAMVVIHEALHHAGLPEKPHDKKAMSSGQINDLVEKSCNL